MIVHLHRRLVCLGLLVSLVALAGCVARSTVETRRQERLPAYTGLTDEHRSAVDQGQIKVGMGEDAVYIAWGKPAQTLGSGDASGETTTWLYHGSTSNDYIYWRYHPVIRPDGSRYLERTMARDSDVRAYVSAELTFRDGKLLNWRTLARPPSNTYFGAP